MLMLANKVIEVHVQVNVQKQALLLICRWWNLRTREYIGDGYGYAGHSWAKWASWVFCSTVTDLLVVHDHDCHAMTCLTSPSKGRLDICKKAC